jgi:hypothetical protein
VFVVVLVITLLSALGLFAMRSATFSNVTAGYSRQMTQTHYMTEYALTVMATDLGGPARQNYAELMRSGEHTAQCTGASTQANPTCFSVYYVDLEKRVFQRNGTGEGAAKDDLLAAAVGVGGGGAVEPGSLGPAGLEGDLRIELADIHEAMPPMSGMALTGPGAGTLGYYSVTMTATGTVRPATADRDECDPNAQAAAGVETSRAHVVVGPISR